MRPTLISVLKNGVLAFCAKVEPKRSDQCTGVEVCATWLKVEKTLENAREVSLTAGFGELS